MIAKHPPRHKSTAIYTQTNSASWRNKIFERSSSLVSFIAPYNREVSKAWKPHCLEEKSFYKWCAIEPRNQIDVCLHFIVVRSCLPIAHSMSWNHLIKEQFVSQFIGFTKMDEREKF